MGNANPIAALCGVCLQCSYGTHTVACCTMHRRNGRQHGGGCGLVCRTIRGCIVDGLCAGLLHNNTTTLQTSTPINQTISMCACGNVIKIVRNVAWRAKGCTASKMDLGVDTLCPHHRITFEHAALQTEPGHV